MLKVLRKHRIRSEKWIHFSVRCCSDWRTKCLPVCASLVSATSWNENLIAAETELSAHEAAIKRCAGRLRITRPTSAGSEGQKSRQATDRHRPRLPQFPL